MKTILHYTVCNLSYHIQGNKIFEDFNLKIDEPQMVALAGSSGSGKTTLLNCLGLILKATSGSIIVDGEEASSWSDRRRLAFWRDRASFIYQDYGIIEEESVEYNVCLNVKKLSDPNLFKALERVGISHLAKTSAVKLSGGEKQRLGIARAIYKKADLIFADEPTASLDLLNRQRVLGYLQEQVNSGSIVLVATHDEELMAHCDSVFFLKG